MPALLIVQARLGSSRLPAKALLPICDMPIAVLAAKRAANKGLPVRVATTTERIDDALVAVLRNNEIETFRGSMQDVLQRFVVATADLDDDGIIVRLTADNVFPDGDFVEELLVALHSGIDYVGVRHPDDQLPYGMSAEAFRIRALREADKNASSVYDREHVTPWMRRNLRVGNFRAGTVGRNMSDLRCTIDTLRDYERIVRTFSGVSNAVCVGWQNLCERLLEQAVQPRTPQRLVAAHLVSELTIGTAQLGLESYGRTNVAGRPDEGEALKLISTAIDHGVMCFDTARAYDRAEHILGNSVAMYGDQVTIVTKLDPLEELAPDASEAEVWDAVDASIYRSCRELRQSTLQVLLLHRWRHFSACGGRIWQRLLELKSHSVIAALGASVSTPQEAKEALEEAEIKHLQLPFNLLDKRWVTAGIDRLARERPDVTIYARSVLLQGILIGSPTSWPEIAKVSAEIIVKRICELTKQLNRVNRVDLCIAFVRGHDWIDSLVIGMESVSQLHDLIAFFQRPALSQTEVELVTDSFGPLPETLLNPALWNVK